LIPYRLEEAGGWRIDLEHLEACISTRTRALVLISPHNPTGHVSSHPELQALAEIAARHNLAIISDEVFSEFLMDPEPLPRAASAEAPLVITLNGFSKMFALPGLKFGWMAITGSRDKVAQALRALELISDTFLPVNEIVQASAPEIFVHGRSVAEEFAGRIRKCWEIARRYLISCRNWSYTPPGGGFYLTLRLRDIEEEKAAETILREKGALIHPGYFYDMDPDHMVLCFVQKHETIHNFFPGIAEGLEKLAGQLGTQ
jgi:aspartate/methionine/tyrosine aminotransferase